MQILRTLFFNHVAQTSHSPLALTITGAKDEYLYGEDGKAYLDCISGISVSNVGHNRTEVVIAIKEQAEKYLHTMVYGEHIQQPQVLLAQKLSAYTSNKLDSVYFVNSGAEAVEGAIKLARRYTGRKEVISCKNAYHGSTLGAMSLMSDAYYQQSYGPFLQHVQHIEFNNPSEANKITESTAAVFIELVQSEAGYVPISKEFLNAIHNRCKETGALLIFDEIQTGIGRTGKMFAYEHYSVIPDILLLAKALGAGLPLGAFLSSKEIMQVFCDNPPLGHLTTFGGNPLSCAASLAALNVIEKNHFIESIYPKEQLLFDKLKHTRIIETRGKGLMIGVQLNSNKDVLQVISHCFNKGLLLDWFLFNHNAIRIAPPLSISTEQIEYICNTILEGLDNLS